jgi:hypothetical protein
MEPNRWTGYPYSFRNQLLEKQDYKTNLMVGLWEWYQI